MADEILRPKDVFPLNIVERHLLGFQTPSGAFDPNGNWETVYGVYTLGSRGPAGRKVGSLRLNCSVGEGDRSVLEVQYDKTIGGVGAQRATGKVVCRGDRLATPERWSFGYSTIDTKGRTLPGSALEKTAMAGEGWVEIDDGRRKRRVDVGPAFTLHWTLLAAVQRLPHQPSPLVQFTLIEHFDQVKPDQTLSFRGTSEIVLGERMVKKKRIEQLEKGRIVHTVMAREGGQSVQLHSFDHLGWGVVPWVYWVDDAGRLLFAVSGLEAYLIESAKAL